jgi:hypothetical protein
MEYIVVLDLLFPLPCQRPEGALAGGSRSSRPREGAEAPARSFAHTITSGLGGGQEEEEKEGLEAEGGRG